jgi:MFS family permease
MTTLSVPTRPSRNVDRAAWWHVLRGAAALAAGMGIGRFVYTPILPLMTAQAGLTPSAAASLATANYVGYLLGALLGMTAPALGRSRLVHRAALTLLTATLLAMPFTHVVGAWFALRLLAGVGSGEVFVYAVNSLLSHLRDHPAHLPGLGFSGVGVGIALSGGLVLALRTVGDWRDAWWAAAGGCAVLAATAWTLRPEPAPEPVTAATGAGPRTHRWFTALFVSYALEGVGYIIAGTFLVAAITQNSSGSVGAFAWVLAGLAAVPSSLLWARLGRRWRRPDLLAAALSLQAVGIALPAVVDGVGAALLAAVLFGATFIGVSNIALAAGTHLRFPRSVALLTAGYSAGQILGPLAAAPLLHHGYHAALLLGAAVVLLATAAAGLLRIGFPHRVPDADESRE